MNLSRAKPAASAVPKPVASAAKEKAARKPQLEEFLNNRDYTGSLAFLEFQKTANQVESDANADAFIGFCAFHLGDHKKSTETYQRILRDQNAEPIFHLYLACCYFYLGMYKESEEEALKGPATPLQNRILLHVAHKMSDENKFLIHYHKLQETIEDQLCLASINYMRCHYQDAVDIYKRILLENRKFIALNVYIALCYYKLDYHDVSLEILNVYLQQFPDSAIAINLKACNHYRLYNGKAAELVLKPLLEIQGASYCYDNDLVKHNLTIFRNGEDCLKVLPPLLDVVPEARLNLIIYYLRQQDYAEAHKLAKDLEPVQAHEYILAAVVNAFIGQLNNSEEHLKIAQQYFHMVGSSPSECDTIPGRECMSACFFLLKRYDEVLIYLRSIKSYFFNDDEFNWNFGVALAASSQFKESEEVLLQVKNDSYRADYVYLSWLARCFIMNGNPRGAWELYLTMETSSESFSLLQLIANDCYKVGAFFIAAKAFDVLERLDPNPEFWEGKRGACVGVFQQVIAGREQKGVLRDIVNLIAQSNSPQAEYIAQVMRRWGTANGVKF